MKGGRQTTDYRFRGGTPDQNATSAQRAAQQAFSGNRSGGFQTASKGSTVQAAIGDLIAIENTSTAAADRPKVVLPKVTEAMSGKSVYVTFAANSTTAEYKSTGTDAVNAGASSAVDNRTITSPVVMHQYFAVGIDHGWRFFALSS